MMGNHEIELRPCSDGFRAYVVSEDGDETLYVSPPCATEADARKDALAWIKQEGKVRT